jgi:type II secretory pathway pseudopilin PulG
MSKDPSSTPSTDELLLIDYLLGRADAGEAREVERRLQSEPAFRAKKEALANTFAAIRLLPPVEPPEGLVERTLARVELVRRAEARTLRQETARPWANSTFSLRELIAVAASIILVVSVLLPSFRQARSKAMQGQCASNMGQIGTAVSSYASENAEFLPAAMDQKAQWLPAGNQPTVSNSSALFKLVRRGLASASAFQCPGVGSGGFAVQDNMTDFPGAKYINYSYQHSLSPEGQLRRDRFSPKEQESMAIAADQSPIFTGGQFHAERVDAPTSENHRSAGQNVLYLNSAVRWVNQPNVGVNGDNIFRAGTLTNYTGNETPASRLDTFLLPATYQKP